MEKQAVYPEVKQGSVNEITYMELSCRQFAELLGSREPVPGGGGTSALVAVLGASLSNMVGNLTIGKKKYADVEEEIRVLMARMTEVREQLMELVEEDARSFEPLSRAYRLPKSTPEEAAYKEQIMEESLRNAAYAPLEIMRKICMIIPMIRIFAEKGSVIAVSDAGVSATVCAAALRGASLNVFVNTRMMKDREYAEAMNAECREMLEKFGPKADSVYEAVHKRMTEGQE